MGRVGAGAGRGVWGRWGWGEGHARLYWKPLGRRTRSTVTGLSLQLGATSISWFISDGTAIYWAWNAEVMCRRVAAGSGKGASCMAAQCENGCQCCLPGMIKAVARACVRLLQWFSHHAILHWPDVANCI